MKFYEIAKRSILKAITFRLVILIADSLIIFFLTHRYDVTIAVVLISNFSSTILYVAHERVWNKIHWGKNIEKKSA